MGIPNATKQAASNAVAALGTWASAHTGAGGGTTGANEASGGGYGRRQVSWTPGSTGVNTSTEATIPVAAGTYTEAGCWSAQTTGTFVGSGAFAGGSVVISGSGASIVLSLTITA